MDVCGCKECDLPVLALGMCNKHWRRTKAYGSPFVLTSHSGMFRGMPAPKRFDLQHKKGDGCWIWSASIDAYGYGKFRGEIFGATYQAAHRFSWALHNGQAVPEGMHVCHSCDNPRCVNPAHLWIGTANDNMQDKHAKGRHSVRRGQDSVDAVLTEAQVRLILADIRPNTQISADYGVKPSTVSSIKTRKSWAHLDVDHVAKAPRVSHRKGKSDRINEEIVREIRSTAIPGSELADRYGVSRQLITNIRKRGCWAHVE